MDNFVEFLLDYYVWILVVLGIIIITIIGFLVDSKQKRKKKEQGKSENLNEVQTVEPLPDSKTQDIPVVNIKNERVNDSTYNNVNVTPNYNQSQPSIMQEKTDNNVSNLGGANQELTLNNQTPHFEPKEIPMSYNYNNNQNVVPPRPVNAVSINNQSPSQVIQPNVQMSQPASPVVNGVQNTNTAVIEKPMQYGYNNQNNVQNTMGYNNINNVNKPATYQNVPSQRPAYQPQQPVGTIPNAPVNQVAAIPIQNQQPINNLGNVNSKPVATVPNVGINFVTGEVNKNDDTWQL